MAERPREREREGGGEGPGAPSLQRGLLSWKHIIEFAEFPVRLGLAAGTGKMEGAVVCVVGNGEDGRANVSEPQGAFQMASHTGLLLSSKNCL